MRPGALGVNVREPEGAPTTALMTPAAVIALLVSAGVTLHLGLWPGPVLSMAQRAVGQLLP